MTKNANFVSHKKSKQIVDGKPKLPLATDLVEGEIAINFAENVETLSIKNESGDVVTFSSDNYYTEKKLGSGFTGENSANTVTSVIESNEKVTALALADLDERKLEESDLSYYYKKSEIDNLVGSGFSYSSITEVITENEEIVSSALVDLDERKLDASAYTPSVELWVSGTGENAIVQKGGGNTASGKLSIAMGSGTTASGDYSVAEGNSTSAMSPYSHAEGRNTFTTGYGSEHAEGYGTSGIVYSHAEGYGTFAVNYSHTEGHSTSATSYSHAEGYNANANNYSHAEGSYTKALGDYSHAEGNYAKALGYISHAEGNYTIASGNSSHAEGSNTIANGMYSHAEGYSTSAMTDYSHAEGNYTIASGDYSHAEGYSTSAITDYSHAEGNSTTASGQSSHAEGSHTTASGKYSHAEGDSATASGESSHAEGRSTNASGNYSHAEGYYATASGNYSHAEGDHTTASGKNSHVEGYYTTASGQYSHAEGNSTKAIGLYSHTEGDNTTANNLSEHASGCYNVSNSASTTFGDSGNTLFSVGNGNYNAPHNAFEIRQNGDIYITSGGTTSSESIKLQDYIGSPLTVDQVLDDTTSASTNPVSSKAVYDAVTDNELVWTNAFVALSGTVSAHTANTEIHVTAADKEKLHTHSNKTSLDSITGNVGTMAYEDKASYSSATDVNTALDSKVNTSDVVSAITPSNSGSTDPIATKVVSNALNDLNTNKADKEDLGGLKLVKVTQAEYDALVTKDPNTLYVIVN